jgi:hypothetical protein
MLNLLLMFALAASSPAASSPAKARPCPPAGFEHVEYMNEQVAATLATEIEHQLGLFGNQGWGGPAGMVGRPAAADVDLYIQPDGKVAAVCVVSGERHVVAEVARDLALLKVTGPRERLIVPLHIQFIWRSGKGDLGLTEFNLYGLKIDVAPRP